MRKKIVILCMLSFVLFGYVAMAADTVGGLGSWIGELGSGALIVVAIFIMSRYVFAPTRDLFKSLSKGLDANTEALHKAVENNDKIISNHLASERADRDYMVKVFEPLAEEIAELNKWHEDNGK